MPEFIIRAEETDLFFLFKDYKELIRCKDCKHFDKDEFCDIWEVYRTNESYCDIAEREEHETD